MRGQFITLHICAIAVIAAIGFSTPAFALEGDLDPTFARGTQYSPGRLAIPPLISGSQDDTAYAVAIQADGKILIAGRAGGTGISGTLAVVRLWQDGTLDTTFGNGTGAYVMPLGSSSANSVSLASDGDIILSGSLGNQELVVAVRPDGSGLDGTFGTTSPGVTLVNVNGDTSNTTSISDLKIDPFDNIFVTGNYNGSSHQQMMLGLLTATGRVLTTEANDNALGGYGDQFAAALAIQPDGKLIVAGYGFYNPTNAYIALVVRHDMTLTGSEWHFPLDTSYAVGGVSNLQGGGVNGRSLFNDTLALLPSGYVVAAGRVFDPATSMFGNALAYSLDTAGQIDSVLLTAVTPFDGNSIRKAVPDARGNVVFTGFSGWNDDQGDSGSGFFAMRANATSLNVLDTSFGNAGIRFFMFDERGTSNDQSFGAALDRYGRVVIVGNTQYGITNPEYPVMGVARLTSDLIFENGVELHE